MSLFDEILNQASSKATYNQVAARMPSRAYNRPVRPRPAYRPVSPMGGGAAGVVAPTTTFAQRVAANRDRLTESSPAVTAVENDGFGLGDLFTAF